MLSSVFSKCICTWCQEPLSNFWWWQLQVNWKYGNYWRKEEGGNTDRACGWVKVPARVVRSTFCTTPATTATTTLWGNRRTFAQAASKSTLIRRFFVDDNSFTHAKRWVIERSKLAWASHLNKHQLLMHCLMKLQLMYCLMKHHRW